MKKDQINLEYAIEEIHESIRLLLKKQDTHYSDLALKINKLKSDLIRNDGSLEQPIFVSNDDLYEQAQQAVVSSKKASTSFLQRKLGIGYSRASCLMDLLESKKVIGPAKGATPRKILIKK